MSIEALTWVFTQSETVGTDRLVLLALANYADEDGFGWPSTERLAHLARVSRRTAQRSLASMAEASIIGIIPNGAPDMRIRPDRRPNAYQIHGVTQLSPRGDDGVTRVTPRGDTVVAITVTEPSSTDNPSPSHDAVRLCNLLSDLMVANGVKQPNITQTWITDMDRIMRLDGRTPAQVERMIRWSQADPFWMANIHSPKKLRQKYDTMKLRAKAGPSSSGRVAPVTQSNNVLRDFAMGGSSESEGHGNGAGDLHGQLAAQGT